MPHREDTRTPRGRRPRCGFARRHLPGAKLDDSLEGRNEIGVAGEQYAHVVVATRGHQDDIHGQRDVDTFLLSTSRRPVAQVTKVAGDDRDQTAGPTPRLGLAAERRERPRISAPTWPASVDADLRKDPMRYPRDQKSPQRNGVDLPGRRRTARQVERLTSAVVDVLPVEEDADAALVATHERGWRRPQKNPACAALPGRRGALTAVYRGTQLRRIPEQPARLKRRRQALPALLVFPRAGGMDRVCRRTTRPEAAGCPTSLRSRDAVRRPRRAGPHGSCPRRRLRSRRSTRGR